MGDFLGQVERVQLREVFGSGDLPEDVLSDGLQSMGDQLELRLREWMDANGAVAYPSPWPPEMPPVTDPFWASSDS